MQQHLNAHARVTVLQEITNDRIVAMTENLLSLPVVELSPNKIKNCCTMHTKQEKWHLIKIVVEILKNINSSPYNNYIPVFIYLGVVY